jgi:hypothetical protein
VPNYAPEKGKGHPPVMEAEAAAAMTCPGVPTLRKRLRPAERVETESAIYAECCSRRPDRSHGNGGEVVAAHYPPLGSRALYDNGLSPYHLNRRWRLATQQGNVYAAPRLVRRAVAPLSTARNRR